jgi:hypothetical protein
MKESKTETKKPYSPPTLTKLNPEQAKQFMVDRTGCIDLEAENVFESLRREQNLSVGVVGTAKAKTEQMVGRWSETRSPRGSMTKKLVLPRAPNPQCQPEIGALSERNRVPMFTGDRLEFHQPDTGRG